MSFFFDEHKNIFGKTKIYPTNPRAPFSPGSRWMKSDCLLILVFKQKSIFPLTYAVI